jgi:Trp operon repressor
MVTPFKTRWQDRVRYVHKLRFEDEMSIRELVEHLDSSIGTICRDLLLAEGLKKFPKELEAIPSYMAALRFCKKNGIK